MVLFLPGYLRKSREAFFEVLVRGDVVAHLAVVILLIGNQVEVAGAGQTEEDRLGFAGLLAFERFIDRDFDRM